MSDLTINKQHKSFEKKYKISTINRTFSLGIKKYGAKIVSGELCFLGLFVRDKISIENIDQISYDIRKEGKALNYFYIITDKSGKEHPFIYFFLDKSTYRELITDLLTLNPKIKITGYLTEILSDILPKKLELKFNFQKKDIASIVSANTKLHLEHPFLDVLIAFIAIFLAISIMFAFGYAGEHFIIERFGSPYPSYRIGIILIGGLALSIAVLNLLSTLLSMYFGHKATIILLIIAIVGLTVGLI